VKRYVSFILQQAFEVWVWYQVLLLFLGKINYGYTAEQLFVYYMVSMFLAFVAMVIVYLPQQSKFEGYKKVEYQSLSSESRKRQEKTESILLGNDRKLKFLDYLGIVFLIVMSVIVAPMLWETVLKILTNSIFPVISLWLIFGLFVYKILVCLIKFNLTKDHIGIKRETAQFVGHVVVFLTVVLFLAFLDGIYLGTLSNQNFLLLAIPLTIMFNFFLMMYEEGRILKY
jgi:hypothetical protein